MLTFDINWIAPIHIGAAEDQRTIVDGPRQALKVLEDDWPTTGGKHHQAAIRECKLACSQLGRSEKAREAFMAAALEAGVLIFATRKSQERGRFRAEAKARPPIRIGLPL